MFIAGHMTQRIVFEELLLYLKLSPITQYCTTDILKLPFDVGCSSAPLPEEPVFSDQTCTAFHVFMSLYTQTSVRQLPDDMVIRPAHH